MPLDPYSTSVSYDMLVRALRPNVILHEPEFPVDRTFGWASSVHWERGPIPEKNMVIVCRERALEHASGLFPDAFLVVLTTDDAFETSRLPEASILVKADENENVLQRIQNYFLEIQFWQSNLRAISSGENALEDILRQGAQMLGAPLLAYDMDGRCVARATPTDKEHLLDAFDGVADDIIDNIAFSSPGSLNYPSPDGTLYIESRIVSTRYENLYYLLGVFDENARPDIKDLISWLAQFILSQTDEERALATLPRHSIYVFFDNLINKRYIGKRYLDEYSSMYRIPLDADFRLLRITNERGQLSSLDTNALISQARALNGGNCLVTVYDASLLVLLHSKSKDDSLSNLTINAELELLDWKGDCLVAASQVFSGVTNINYAYQQVALVGKYRKCVDINHGFATGDAQQSKRLYTFEEVYLLALLDSADMTQELKDFSSTHTVLEKIIDEDLENGGEDARILAMYLRFERKATEVAQRLHMHRNTVLYRINKITSRYGLDLDREWTRYRLMLDFDILYCRAMRDPDLLEQLSPSIAHKDE